MKSCKKVDYKIKIALSVVMLIVGLELITISNIKGELEDSAEILENTVSISEKKSDVKKVFNEEIKDNTQIGDNTILYVDNFSLIIPNSKELNIPNDSILTKKKLKISDTLSKYIGKNTDFFDLYLKKDEEKIYVMSTKIVVDIKLEEDSSFQGFYKVYDEKEVEELPYYKINDNEVEVEIDSLGRYAVRYEDIDVDIGEELRAVSNDLNNEKIWGLAIGTILIITSIYLFIHTVRDKNKIHA